MFFANGASSGTKLSKFNLKCYEVAHRSKILKTFNTDSGNDVIVKIWTQDVRDPSFKSVKAGDTCDDHETTGIEYLRIPAEFPQYVRLSPREERRFGWDSDNEDRARFPMGVCRGSAGVFEMHFEIVSGGSGAVYFLCDTSWCGESSIDRVHRQQHCEWKKFINSKKTKPLSYTWCLQLPDS